MVKAMMEEDDGTVIGYMCATDWECELGANHYGNTVFPSLESALENLKCGRSCGIVEVSVSYRSMALPGTEETFLSL